MAGRDVSAQGQSRAPGAETNCGIGPSQPSHAWMFRSTIAGLTEAENLGLRSESPISNQSPVSTVL